MRDRKFARILLIKPTALGDVVHAVPALVELRKRFPAAQIDWLVTPENAELVRHHPALSGVVLFDRRAFRRGWRGLAGLPALVRSLRAPRYELVIDLHGQLRSGAFALATGAPVRIGYDRPLRPRRIVDAQAPLPHRPARGWAGAREGAWLAYTHRLPVPTLEVHAVDRYLWIGEMLGFTPGPPEQRLWLAPEAEESAGRMLGADDAFAVLAPATLWETKHWRRAGFAEAARHLAGRGLRVVTVGSADDRELGAHVLEGVPGALNLCGSTSVGELAAVIRRARLCLSNDSGTAHLANALGTPLVAVFGPTNPVTVGPYRHPQDVVRLELPCSPCNFRRLVQCPNGHACMEQLPAETVIARIEARLSES